jgi:hypothetical protein
MRSSGRRHEKLPGKKGIPRSRLGGFTPKIWIPTLDGFPVGGIKLVAIDPLASKDALAGKVLAIMVAGKGIFTVKTIVAALKAEGLAKDPKAISPTVSQALQILKRLRLAMSGGHSWIASVNNQTKRGRM